MYFLGDSVLRRVMEKVMRKAVFRNATQKLCSEMCVGSQTVSQLRRRLKASQKPESQWHFNEQQEIVVMIGTNDAMRKSFKPQQFMRNLKWLLRDAAKRNLKLSICTIPPNLSQYEFNLNVKKINDIIRRICPAKGFRIVEIANNFPNTQEFFERDRIHPNLEGLKLIYKIIFKK